MTKYLLFIGFFLSSFASAEPANLVCDNQDSSILFVLEQLTAADTATETDATARFLVVKLPGYKAGDRFDVTGTKSLTTKGDVFKVSDKNGKISVQISAQSAEAYDGITINGGETIDLLCTGN